jgi:hypothetical protein
MINSLDRQEEINYCLIFQQPSKYFPTPADKDEFKMKKIIFISLIWGLTLPFCGHAGDMQALGVAKGDKYQITAVAALDKPQAELISEGPRKLGIYRDALRAYGLDLMTASPELLLN